MSTSTAATGTSAGDNRTWADLPPWLVSVLTRAPFEFRGLLPVQQTVIPFVQRALRSGVPLDVCLCAPTGSGKTLCYLAPMLQMLGEEKRVVNDTRLRGLVLVPTNALGEQVYRVAKKLSEGTTIHVVSICGDVPRNQREGDTLVRCVSLQHSGLTVSPTPTRALLGESALLLDEAVGEEHTSGGANIAREDLDEARNVEASGDGIAPSDVSGAPTASPPSAVCRYYSRVDVLVATPQRLLKHLTSTTGFSLRDLRCLVLDEADQILGASGSFSNLICRILRLCEGRDDFDRIDHHRQLPRRVLHKMLCSATISTHISRISEVRLRNCRHFALTTTGETASSAGTGDGGNDEENAPPRESLAATGTELHLTQRLSIPPGLHEHVLTLRSETERPAVLLKLLQNIFQQQEEQQQQQQRQGKRPRNAGDDADVEALAGSDESNVVAAAVASPSSTTEAEAASRGRSSIMEASVGRTVVVFCNESDVARVLAKFLSRCGIVALDFTAASSVAERRRFVMSGVTGKSAVLVTTDALMRGVDLPGVGAVVMYDAPKSVIQFIHRVGRTARAMREGHAFMLLEKKGPSGDLQDGEVAAFRKLDRFLTRSRPVVYDRSLLWVDDAHHEYTEKKLKETYAALRVPATAATGAASMSTASSTAKSKHSNGGR